MAQFHQGTASDGSIVLRVVGEIDLSEAEDLKAAVRACLPATDRVELDMSGLTFIDSSGLGALVQLRREAARQRSSLTLTHVGASTYRLLEVTGLAPVFDVRLDAKDPDDVRTS